MAKVLVIYGSTTGNTESAAKIISQQLRDHEVECMDVSNVSKSDFESASVLILGTSTWGYGDLQDDWDSAIDTLKGANLSGKKVAIFGCGDSSSYPDTFVDGMSYLKEAAEEAGASIIGQVSTEGYSHEDSKSVEDGMFIGLALDDDESDSVNQSRMAEWIKKVSGLI